MNIIQKKIDKQRIYLFCYYLHYPKFIIGISLVLAKVNKQN